MVVHEKPPAFLGSQVAVDHIPAGLGAEVFFKSGQKNALGTKKPATR